MSLSCLSFFFTVVTLAYVMLCDQGIWFNVNTNPWIQGRGKKIKSAYLRILLCWGISSYTD